MEKAELRQQVLLERLMPTSSSCSPVHIIHQSVCLLRHCVSDDDIVIVAAYRTPICKAKQGGFKDSYPEDLLEPVLKAVIESSGISPQEVRDRVVGTVLAPGSQRAMECLMTMLYASFLGGY
eukprot:TRINITY_DN3448_c1_g3_i7.p1 TRINITY_DN3448_c1_g3~~TRINITY_DN3448_c1_g3_i7.p1  ORF type:complete len:122 (-),score=11.53 TRINITY_DN3448_c1_g3_i7:33-398(-)